MGRGLYGTRYVTGAHQAVPTTLSRQSPKRLASPDNLRKWAENQIRLLETINLDSKQLGEALLAANAIGVDLGSKYFLYNTAGHIVYFSEMNFNATDKIFVCCNRNPVVNRIELSIPQNWFLFCPREWKETSNEFSYVLEFSSQIHNSNYGIVELYGEDCTSNLKTAMGQLFAEIRRRGFQPQRSDLCEQTAGKYIGPDGGHPDFPSNKIKKGMPIKATGIVITVAKS